MRTPQGWMLNHPNSIPTLGSTKPPPQPISTKHQTPHKGTSKASTPLNIGTSPKGAQPANTSTPERLVGKRVRVYWPNQKQWYPREVGP